MIKIDFPTEQIKAWVEKAKNKPLEFVVEFLQDINEQIVYATPYITGNLRGHWYAGLNDEPDASAGAPDAGGGAIARLNIVLADLKLGDVYYGVNGAVYGPRVEYGFEGKDSLGREFHQAPRAFVRGTLDRAQEIGDAAALRVSQT
jgi:hypothetical protein